MEKDLRELAINVALAALAAFAGALLVSQEPSWAVLAAAGWAAVRAGAGAIVLGYKAWKAKKDSPPE